jgi:polar amino acid transport system substrate-binding protein
MSISAAGTLGLVVALGICCVTSPTRAAEFRLVTHPLAPFTTGTEGAPGGLAIEMVQRILARTGDTGHFVFEPFPRVLRDVKSGPLTIGFIVARTPEREHDMQWVGPLVVNGVYFYQRAGRPTALKSLDDARALGSIGVQNNDADRAYLEKLGFKNLELSESQKTDVIKLYHGHIDATPMGELVFPYLAKEAGLAMGDFERTPVKLYDSAVYLALSPDIPKDVVQTWATALDAIKATSEQTALMSRYLDQ